LLLAIVMKLKREHKFPREVIFLQGKPAKKFYILVSFLRFVLLIASFFRCGIPCVDACVVVCSPLTPIPHQNR
jgi:hypothetical protein